MKSWKFIDKSEWEEGEWNKEPDKAQWIDEKTGLDCLIHRNPGGALCGYVGVPESHKYFKIDYNNVEPHPEVHGGLTYSDLCGEQLESGRGICHAEECAANKIVWWLGFDCAHCDDICPGFDFKYGPPYYSSYKNFDYVKSEVEYLAKQLSEA